MSSHDLPFQLPFRVSCSFLDVFFDPTHLLFPVTTFTSPPVPMLCTETHLSTGNPSAAISMDLAFTGSLVTHSPRSFSASVVDSGVFPMWYWCAGYPFTGSLVTYYTPRSFSVSVVDSGVFPMWYWCAGYPFTGSLVTYTPRSFSASVVDGGVFPMWYWCAGYPFTGSLVTYTPRSFSASVVDSGVFPMWYWYAGYPFTGSLVTYTPRSFSASMVDSGVFPMWYWCAGYPLPRCRTLHVSPLNCSSHFLFHSCSLVMSSGRKSTVKGLVSPMQELTIIFQLQPTSQPCISSSSSSFHRRLLLGSPTRGWPWQKSFHLSLSM
ncbi:uncharacterized protein LOC126988115 [Eriocheir sinensis]|uniref:uncharacterized protein LOC126988115 n=1 Tax=Eriocheir sinensis TaxID=95602 RepID=UPI0021C6E054|nr:uncharacterized protein LOC126988115 [Eriocheir sinensis]